MVRTSASNVGRMTDSPDSFLWTELKEWDLQEQRVSPRISHIGKTKGERKACEMNSTAEGESRGPTRTGFGGVRLKELSSPTLLAFLLWYPPREKFR